MSKSKLWFIFSVLIILSMLAISQVFASPERKHPATTYATCNVPSASYATIAAALADPTCDPIVVAAGAYYENLTVSRSVTVQGNSAATTIVDGGGIGSVFVITNTAAVTLTGLTIQHGAGTDYAGSTSGGGIYNYDGNLTLQNSVVYSNTADWGGGMSNDYGSVYLEDVIIEGNVAQWAGGVANMGTMALTSTQITGNQATGWVGGLYNWGGQMTIDSSTISYNTAPQAAGGQNETGTTRGAMLMIYNSQIISNTATDLGGAGLVNTCHPSMTATLTVDGSLIGYNTANGSDALNGTGGGIWNSAGDSDCTSLLTVNNSTISHNRAVNGGGIANARLTVTPNHKLLVTVNNSTISHNSTLALTGNQVGNGGGVFNMNGTMTLTNCTVSGNAANGIPGTGTDVSGMGGGAVNAGVMLPSQLTLINTTVTGNYAFVTGGGLGTGLLDAAAMGTATILKNTIVAGNSATMLSANCTSQPGAVPNMFVSQGYNLDSDGTCNLTQPTDLPATNPLLGPLMDNGGDTWTHALLLGSPAIDAIPLAACTVPTDQRGVARPQGVACDIGAYEATTPQLSIAKIVTPTNVPHHGVVTYTISLGNTGAVSDTNITLTDILPDDVLFDMWVISPANTLHAGEAFTWTGSLAPQAAITFTFTAIHTGDYLDVITNTAYFTGTMQKGHADAVFSVMPEELTLEVIVTPTGAGAVTQDPPTGPYYHGDTITLTATPAQWWAFAGWSGDLEGTALSRVFTITHNMVITAAFTQTCIPVAGVGFDWNPHQPLVGEAVQFTAAVMTGTSPLTYTWHFGDGTAPLTTTLSSAEHIFPSLATEENYTVTLQVFNPCTKVGVATSKALIVVPRRVYLPLVVRN